jgi:putative flippase GtrA
MKLSPKMRRELERFMKFSVVGVVGAIVDFGTFNLLANVIGLYSILSSAISFTAAVTSNFIWNYNWTYPDSRSKPIRRQAIQFAVVNVIGLAIRTPIFAISENPFIRLAEDMMKNWPINLPPGPGSFMPIEPLVVGRNLALALAVIVVLFWNFGVNRVWTYSDVD